MRFKVFKLRRKGHRLPWRDMINGPFHIGDLQSHVIDHRGQRYNVITLQSIEAPIEGSLLPELYEPVLLGFSTLAFRLRGFERWGGRRGRSRSSRNGTLSNTIIRKSLFSKASS